MDRGYQGIAVKFLISEFSPRCYCGAGVIEAEVSFNDACSGYDRRLVLDITCWRCCVEGRVTVDFLLTYIYDVEGPFSLNEEIKIPKTSGRKAVRRTNKTEGLEIREVLLEVWTILNETR